MAVVGLQKGAPKKTFSKRRCSSKKKIKKTTSDVPEMKLFKLFIIGLKKKKTMVKRHCVDHTLFFS